MNTLPPFDHGRPTGYVLCADERFRRFLENELEQTGVRPLSVSAPSAIPAESLPSCVILWDTDHFPAPTTPPPCGLLLFGHTPAEDVPTEGSAVYLRRPFSLGALASAVAALLQADDTASVPRAIAPAPRSLLRLKDGEVVVGDRSVPLSPAEHAVLSCLYAAGGATVTRETLAPLVGGGNSVEVYVCHLRAKIEKPLGRRLIHTVRGVGYRLDPSLFS